MDLVTKHIDAINEDKYDADQLLNLRKNALENTRYAELDRQRIVDSIDKKLRADHCKIANKLLGKPDSAASEYLESVLASIDEQSTSWNTLARHVKTGGGKISGDAFIDVYVYLKARSGYGACLAVYQRDYDSDLKIIARHTLKSNSPDGALEEESLPFQTGREKISHTFFQYLEKVSNDEQPLKKAS